VTLAYFVCAAITAVDAAVSLGFTIASVRRESGEARTAALYTLARSVALFVVAIVAFFVGSVAFVAAVALAMVLLQAFDAGIGVSTRNRGATIGPAVIAALNLAALIWMLVA
jgi:hypothetical protein